ncbi:MAG: DNA topoisomerase I [archaeon]
MKLVIVEKPIAAQKIASIFGKYKTNRLLGIEYYSVGDSIFFPLKGHVFDVDFPDEYSNWTKVNPKELIFAPIILRKINDKICAALEQLVKDADEIIISTDYDREGESIGKEALSILLSVKKIPYLRAVFSAITPEEIKKAFSNLVEFNWNLADAADTRREIDLIWGAVLTRYLSLTSNRLGKDFLSAGRVQTPMLALVVQREKEILNFKPDPFWVIYLKCEKNGETFVAIHEKEKFFDKSEFEKVLSSNPSEAKVVKSTSKILEISPPEPFNTTEFLRACSFLGFQPQRAMQIAEKLYMEGYISYPRTDNTVYPKSLNLKEILNKLSKGVFSNLAQSLLKLPKITPTSGKKATTDHPPIHPVENASPSELSKQEWMIYELVVRRFFATLAPNEKLESLKIILEANGQKYIAHGRRIIDAGWKYYYPYSKQEEIYLPQLKEGEVIPVKIAFKQDFTKPKPRYTPAALLKEMEDLNLGTKSTRAEILQKLIDRGYLVGKKTFSPSPIAFAVIDILSKYVPAITKPDMTSALEEEMNKVELGQKKKENVVSESRQMLLELYSQIDKNSEKIANELKSAIRTNQVLGVCSCGGNLIVITSKNKKRFVGCTNYSKGCKVSFPLPAKGKITPLGELCPLCKTPKIKISNKKRSFEMCLDLKCPSKKGWVRGDKDKLS